MEKIYVIWETVLCECGYPHDEVFGIYRSREEAEVDFQILVRKDEIQETTNYRLEEKEVTKPSLQSPTYLKYMVLYDDDEKLAHVFGAPSFANIQEDCPYSDDSIDVPLKDGHYHEFKRSDYRFILYSSTLGRLEFNTMVEHILMNEGWKVIK